MPNPHPVPYLRANHKPDCPCPACKSKHGKLKKHLHIQIEPELYDNLYNKAKNIDVSVTSIVEDALKKHFNIMQ